MYTVQQLAFNAFNELNERVIILCVDVFYSWYEVLSCRPLPHTQLFVFAFVAVSASVSVFVFVTLSIICVNLMNEHFSFFCQTHAVGLMYFHPGLETFACLNFSNNKTVFAFFGSRCGASVNLPIEAN
jgi:hypothetical protein